MIERTHYTADEVAELSGVAIATLQKWRQLWRNPCIPPEKKPGPGGFFPLCGNRTAYPIDEVERWLAERRRKAIRLGP